MLSLRRNQLVIFVFGIFVLLTLTACTTDAQRIDDANEAARKSQQNTPSINESNTASSSVSPSNRIQRTGTISVFEVRDGDCFNSNELVETELSEVELVDCAEDWDERAINSFVVDLDSGFPGDFYFVQPTIEKCDRRSTYPLQPTKESWDVGDRTISCIQESFGERDLEKLNRTINAQTLKPGECFKEVDVVEILLVESIDCLGEWDFQVISKFEISGDGPYPGDSYIEDEVQANCSPGFEFFYSPDVGSWAWGDRLVTCIVSR